MGERWAPGGEGSRPPGAERSFQAVGAPEQGAGAYPWSTSVKRSLRTADGRKHAISPPRPRALGQAWRRRRGSWLLQPQE